MKEWERNFSYKIEGSTDVLNVKKSISSEYLKVVQHVSPSSHNIFKNFHLLLSSDKFSDEYCELGMNNSYLFIQPKLPIVSIPYFPTATVMFAIEGALSFWDMKMNNSQRWKNSSLPTHFTLKRDIILLYYHFERKILPPKSVENPVAPL